MMVFEHVVVSLAHFEGIGGVIVGLVGGWGAKAFAIPFMQIVGGNGSKNVVWGLGNELKEVGHERG